MKRQRLLAIGLLIAAIGVIIPVAALGTTSSTFNGLKDGGYLRLHFPDAAAPATFKQYQADGITQMANQSQNITVGNSCTVSFGGPQLATVTASATVGAETSGTKFVGLGVKGKGSTGTNCGRVEPGETITLALGMGLMTTDLGDGSSLVVTAAELDVDSKGQALIRADLFNGGSTPVGFALLSTSSSGGDSGPDATSGDNFALPLNSGMPACAVSGGQPVPPAAGQVCGTFAPFRKVTLSTTTRPSGTPSFALEGGRAGDARSAYAWDTFDLRANTADTVFKLMASDGILACGDEKTASNGTDSFKRGTNNKDGSDCIVVGYDYNQTIDANTKSVELLWDTASQPGATFSLTQTWLPEDSTTLPDGRPIPSKSTLVQWDGSMDFIVAPACTNPSLPTVFGTLASDLGTTDNTVAITLAGGVTAKSDAFNLQIGNEVISIPAQTPTSSGSVVTYSGVTHGAGDTDPAIHTINTKVMTTPFPIITVGGNDIVAQMCIAQSSWIPTGITANGKPQVQVTETLFAEGDMIGKH